MQNNTEKILVWLPSPLGDAILCAPALRSLRERFSTARITFFGKHIVREILTPCRFNDDWIEQKRDNPFFIAVRLRKKKFDQAILFKNSFSSALAVFLAGVGERIGYARDGRGFLLTEKLHPPKLADRSFKPFSMIDYYLAIASWLGANIADRRLALEFFSEDKEVLFQQMPEISKENVPVVIMVPGGAFGPSKCWPSERFSATADRLVSAYNAKIVISVAPLPAEMKIAEEIAERSNNPVMNTAHRSLNIGQLKALYALADLVICNDTGPRHIAIAFDRKVITLFGPNDPAWTDTGHVKEIQIVGKAPCAPCAKPFCRQKEHTCMESITVEEVCTAAAKLLERKV